MTRKVEIVQPKIRPPKATRVAAYARVSTESSDSLHSLIAQSDYYTRYITNHKGWKLSGIYMDNAKSGTKDNRPNFQRLLDDCRVGKIDLVITKSVSRFARNTVTLLNTVRELKALGIDVYFEEENLHSNSCEGELMLSIIASIAQEQSLSNSENMKWRIRKNFEQGIPCDGTLLGYRLRDGQYQIEPEEAKLVRLIFDLYLSGMGVPRISNYLNSQDYKTRFGCRWCQSAVRGILTNYNYTGNLLLQKTYRKDHLSKEKMINNGEFPMYHAENTHEGIVTVDEFNIVQDLLSERSEHFYKPMTNIEQPLKGKITCGICGKHYIRRITPTGINWYCRTYKNEGKSACPSKQIPEPTLYQLVEEVGGLDEIESIFIQNNNIVVFKMKDGQEINKTWQDRSRAESWTPEKKEKQSKLIKEKLKCKQKDE